MSIISLKYLLALLLKCILARLVKIIVSWAVRKALKGSENHNILKSDLIVLSKAQPIHFYNNRSQYIDKINEIVARSHQLGEEQSHWYLKLDDAIKELHKGIGGKYIRPIKTFQRALRSTVIPLM